jgi:RNA polymerase sigma-70 factor (ECF subfamily)
VRPAEELRFERHRAHLFALAYRMLGSVADAEDAVQDAWLRWREVDRAAVRDERGFLATAVTRLALDRLRAMRGRREEYVGPWLPEPVLDEGAPCAATRLDEDVSLGLMLALERLSPLERAAFLLHDVFGEGFAEVARALERSEAACRKLASRARARVRDARPRFAVPPEEGARVAAAFRAASREGDVERLRELLLESATLTTDGGGRRPAALLPIHGAERICRFYSGLARKGALAQRSSTPLLTVNGLPGWLERAADGELQTVALEVEGDRVAAIYVTRNPAKLAHLEALLPDRA